MLEIGLDQDGLIFLSYHLYDARGALVAESNGSEPHPKGLTVRCKRGELLLDINADLSTHINYRLYNCDGELLGWSKKGRTRLSTLLRMEGIAKGWVPAKA